MPRWSGLALLAAGCEPSTGFLIGDTDLADTDPPVDEHREYDGANLRIVTPASGAILFLEDIREFTAEVRGADGVVMPADIAWSSAADATWLPVGATFLDEALAPGVHDITAESALPNGDRVAHTIGGVRLQSRWTGTYVGLFTATLDLVIQDTPVTLTCSGAATLGVDVLGETATGGSDCILSLSSVQIPASYVFDLTNDDGVLSGTAGVDLGIAEVPFEATGSIDPGTHALTLSFGGEIPFVGTLEGAVDAERVSLEAP